VLVVVFQWGWFDGLFGYQSPGYVHALAPPLLLAVTFGLSMDYELFLLTRIREAVTPGVNDREAVAEGLRKSAATITGAALIMVSVFAVFATVGADAVKQIGIGEAAAIALDATVVRLVLVPSAMQLMGRWNWWFPHMLERRVPRLAFETGPAATRVGSGPAEAQ
jgi:RND superfamily putative drug exporter